MKKSKSSSKGKRKRSPAADDKKKRAKSIPKSAEKGRKKENEEKLPRKTRWETSSSKEQTDKQQTSTSRNDETSNPEPPRRLKDLLADKKNIVEYLFLTVTATALQEIIPDYLKNHSIEELKMLCFAEIKDMSDESILDIASGTCSSDPVEIKYVNVNPVEARCADTKEYNDNDAFGSSLKLLSPGASESFSSDLLELNASSNEMKDLNNDNEDEAPLPKDQQPGEELQVVESDADLIELEMRARAIRSLLKAKSQSELLSDWDD